MTLAHRDWVPENSQKLIQAYAANTGSQNTETTNNRIDELVQQNRDIHESRCFNLNPASNLMNPRAEAMLSAGMGSRASLGYPGDKYETGLEALEEIEVIAASLCAEVFDANYVELRVPSGAIANLYGFMALCKPGDTIIVPPASIGGHVTHHPEGCAGLYGLNIVEAPADADGYTIDINALEDLAKRIKPRLITIGGSLNLFEHPVADIRRIADSVGAYLLFDAAHQCGIIAGKAWQNPLHQGAHLMTMSTYKSLAGPPGGLIVTNEAAIAERLDAIAFPGMTANFDVSRCAALAITMLDWRTHGAAYAQTMIELAASLAGGLQTNDIDVFARDKGHTQSHQFAVIAAPFNGGQQAAKKLRQSGFLACGIGLPIATVEGDLNGLRIGTPELARCGVLPEHASRMSDLIATALKIDNPAQLNPEVSEWRKQFDTIHFIN